MAKTYLKKFKSKSDIKTSLNTDNYTSNQKPPKTSMGEISSKSGYVMYDEHAPVYEIKPKITSVSISGAYNDYPNYPPQNLDHTSITSTETKSNSITTLKSKNLNSFTDGNARAKIELFDYSVKNDAYSAFIGKTITVQDEGGNNIVFEEADGSFSTGSLVVTGAIANYERFDVIDALGNSVPFMIDTSVTTTTGAITTTASTGTMTLTGALSNNDNFTLTDTAGNTVTFRVKTGETTNDGTLVAGTQHVMIGGSGASTAEDFSNKIIEAINATTENGANNHTLNITASDGGTGIVNLTQDTAGQNGNTQIVLNTMANTTAVDFKNGYNNVVIIGLNGVSTNAGRAGRIRTTMGNVNSFSNGYTLNTTIGGSSATISLTQQNDGVRGNSIIDHNLSNVTVTSFTNTKDFDALNSNSYTAFSIAYAINNHAKFESLSSGRKVVIKMVASGTASNDKTITTTATNGFKISNFANGAASADSITIMDTEGSIAATVNRQTYAITKMDVLKKSLEFSLNSSALAHTINTGYIYKGSERDIIEIADPTHNHNSIKLVNEKVDRVIDWVDQRLTDTGALENNSVQEAIINNGSVSASKLLQGTESPSNGQVLTYNNGTSGSMNWQAASGGSTSRWHVVCGGYKTNNSSATSYYFHSYVNYHSWTASDSSPTSVSFGLHDSAVWCAPAACTITKIAVSLNASGSGTTDPVKIYVFKGTRSNDISSITLAELATSNSITPIINKAMWDEKTISSSNTISAGESLWVAIKKDSTTASSNLYFNITLSGEYT